MRAAAIATLCAVCLVIGFFSAQYWHHQRSNAVSGPRAGQQASAVIERTLDLTGYATLRDAGGQKPQPPLNLPAALLHINLILPRFSESGEYTIMIASARDGTRRVACTTGIAMAEGKQTKLGVTLDLSGAKPGDYFLLTELSGQNDFYSYPLKVQ